MLINSLPIGIRLNLKHKKNKINQIKLLVVRYAEKNVTSKVLPVYGKYDIFFISLLFGQGLMESSIRI